jgi:hypothetical protein
MPIYTSNYLKQLSRNKPLNESTRMFAEASKSHTSFDIFISHSFLDKDEVEGIYLELTRLGYTVYVDWIVDPHLNRNNITKQSATLIRSRMKMSKSLILATSVNAAISKWMPWELGYIDGHTNKCAVLPVAKESWNIPKHFKGLEYLSLYPFIRKVPVRNGGQELFVIDDAFHYILFKRWISGEGIEKGDVNIYEVD